MNSVLDFINEATEPTASWPEEQRTRADLDPYCRKVADTLSDAFLDEFLSALGRLQDCYTGEAFRRGQLPPYMASPSQGEAVSRKAD